MREKLFVAVLFVVIVVVLLVLGTAVHRLQHP